MLRLMQFSLCHGASCCVTDGGGFKIIFGRGTRLNIEASEYRLILQMSHTEDIQSILVFYRNINNLSSNVNKKNCQSQWRLKTASNSDDDFRVVNHYRVKILWSGGKVVHPTFQEPRKLVVDRNYQIINVLIKSMSTKRDCSVYPWYRQNIITLFRIY